MEVVKNVCTAVGVKLAVALRKHSASYFLLGCFTVIFFKNVLYVNIYCLCNRNVVFNSFLSYFKVDLPILTRSEFVRKLCSFILSTKH